MEYICKECGKRFNESDIIPTGPMKGYCFECAIRLERNNNNRRTRQYNNKSGELNE